MPTIRTGVSAESDRFGTADRRAPVLRRIGIAALIVGPLLYLLAETITATAWNAGGYSYVDDWISDLGVPEPGRFQGRDIDSPLAWLMNSGFVVGGLAIAVGTLALAAERIGRSRRATATIGALTGVGYALVGLTHTSTAAAADGTIVLHYLGATAAILGGNTLAIVVGAHAVRERRTRGFGRDSLVFGIVGLIAVVLLAVAVAVPDAPIGVFERASVATVLLFQLRAAAHLLGVRRGAVPSLGARRRGPTTAQEELAMSDTPSPLPRWIGAALATAAAVDVTAEALAAAAWDVRPYDYADDYVNFLGSPYVGEFQGIVISSPLWPLMTAGWIVTALLIGAATLRLAVLVTGWRRAMLAMTAVLQAVGLIAFAVVPLTPATLDAGLIGVYLFGAFASIIAGNLIALLTGLFGARIGLPRWLRTTSIALGAVGLLNIPVTYGWVPIGIAERISVYSYLLWALITGLALLRTRVAAARSSH